MIKNKASLLIGTYSYANNGINFIIHFLFNVQIQIFLLKSNYCEIINYIKL